MLVRISIIGLWAISFIILNYGAKKLADSLPSFTIGIERFLLYLLSMPWLYVLLAFYAVCAILYMVALRFMPLSTVGPVFTILGVIITASLGIIVFGEQMSLAKGIGFGFCLVGIIFILVSS